MNHTGVQSTGWRRQALRNRSTCALMCPPNRRSRTLLTRHRTPCQRGKSLSISCSAPRGRRSSPPNSCRFGDIADPPVRIDATAGEETEAMLLTTFLITLKVRHKLALLVGLVVVGFGR